MKKLPSYICGDQNKNIEWLAADISGRRSVPSHDNSNVRIVPAVPIAVLTGPRGTPARDQALLQRAEVPSSASLVSLAGMSATDLLVECERHPAAEKQAVFHGK